MHQNEPSLFTHLKELREEALVEGGISTVIFCGKAKSDGDLLAVLQTHRSIVEEEVNEEEVNITGILIGQVEKSLKIIDYIIFVIIDREIA
jgi:hypothetical protein